MASVTPVYDKFAVQIKGEVKLYDTEQEARGAAVFEENAEAMLARANAYCDAKGLDPEKDAKNRKGKINVLMQFMIFEAGAKDADEEGEDF